jgi:hypothetical protein
MYLLELVISMRPSCSMEQNISLEVRPSAQLTRGSRNNFIRPWPERWRSGPPRASKTLNSAQQWAARFAIEGPFPPPIMTALDLSEGD